jgi:hypothetical protein
MNECHERCCELRAETKFYPNFQSGLLYFQLFSSDRCWIAVKSGGWLLLRTDGHHNRRDTILSVGLH